ncbi:Uma2 family endonuclease [Acaryochloris sp. IP29b_bin.137]|uniref:Uma2 family endonuclease n=1 Tax=Acaryochloris sp. IP29b_bin.137 TaxID=2969217 RepID=UPI00261035CB|nr:Uma2 family endonuclease [Acaryochloris sp. IP29b_bin.137]
MASTLTHWTFKEYLQDLHSADTRYELVQGELVEMPPPTLQHLRIAKFLERVFDQEIEQHNLAWESLREAGQRTETGTARLPDVLVVRKQDADALLHEPTVFECPGILAVEIVSTNWRDDYLHKLAEYEALGIPEYWIVDYLALGASRYIGSPKCPTLSIYQLIDREYQLQQFQAEDTITSPSFPHLRLTTTQVFQAAI